MPLSQMSSSYFNISLLKHVLCLRFWDKLKTVQNVKKLKKIKILERKAKIKGDIKAFPLKS